MSYLSHLFVVASATPVKKYKQSPLVSFFQPETHKTLELSRDEVMTALRNIGGYSKLDSNTLSDELLKVSKNLSEFFQPLATLVENGINTDPYLQVQSVQLVLGQLVFNFKR